MPNTQEELEKISKYYKTWGNFSNYVSLIDNKHVHIQITIGTTSDYYSNKEKF